MNLCLNVGRGGGNCYNNIVNGEDLENKTTVGSASRNEDNAGMTLTKDQFQNLIALLEKINFEAKCSANLVKGGSSFIEMEVIHILLTLVVSIVKLDV